MTDLSTLRNSGIDVDSLSADEMEALSTLDPSELTALASIRNKLNAAGDVSAHKAPGEGGIVW